MSKVKRIKMSKAKRSIQKGFKPLMSKVKLDKYILFITSKNKKVNKKAKKTPKSTSMSKQKKAKTGKK